MPNFWTKTVQKILIEIKIRLVNLYQDQGRMIENLLKKSKK